MKREKRPFTVEVRRGAKKQTAAVAPPPPAPPAEKTPMQRAEEILFSRDQAAQAKEIPARSGRILEPVVELAATAAPEAEAPQEAPRRRGRPPGSKNKAPPPGRDQKAPRGRPRLALEVRQLKLTPELVTAAIETMTRLAPGQSASPNVEARSFGRGEGFEDGSVPIKRPRGRPRKAPVGAPKTRALEAPPLTAEGGAAAVERLRRPAAQRAAASDSAGSKARARAGRLKRSEVNRLFKPGERWKARMRLRSLARRSRV